MDDDRARIYRTAWRSFYRYWALCWLIFPILAILWKKYSSALILTPDSLTQREGLLNVNSTVVAFEHIQDLEIKQSLIERMLSGGTIQAGTAATTGYEIEFRGAPSPRLIAEEIRRYPRMQNKKER